MAVKRKSGGGDAPPSSAQRDVRQDQSATPLESFLVAAQKSLARSVQSAQQSAKADNEFALGERPAYVIEGLEMELSAGVHIGGSDRVASGERVLLDFDAPGDVRSKIRFRIQSKPVELLTGAKLELANLDPLGEDAPIARLRAWLVDDQGHPVRGHPVVLHFVRAGEKKEQPPVTVLTDAAGRVDFFIDPAESSVKFRRVRKPHKVHLLGSGNKRNPDEYFVWASTAVAPEWKTLATPSAPKPPHPIQVKDDRPTELVSELHRLRTH
jgi:hypothetical protein